MIINVCIPNSGDIVNTTNPTESLIMTIIEMSIGGNINENMFEAAVAAMRMDGELYGYPTLVCGNFVTSIGPAFLLRQQNVQLIKEEFHLMITIRHWRHAKKNLLSLPGQTTKLYCLGK